MEIQLTVIEDLGVKLYGKLPPVISEIVANSWDADAAEVRIELPEGDIDDGSTITIRDDGGGMSRDDILRKYLVVGRKRREEGGSETPGGRVVMGRKGIGKISVFGAARRVAVTTIKGGKRNGFKMDIDDILRCAKDSGAYEPDVTADDEDSDEPDGTTITLAGLKRKTGVVPETVRRGIARHFSVIGGGFEVYVNDNKIVQSDKFKESDIEKTWAIAEEPVAEGSPWMASGRIMATFSPLDEEDRGLAIMARGKLIQSPTTLDVKSGEKYSYSYITGTIRAEFMDDEEDLILTNRQSVMWDGPRGEALRAWCTGKLRKVSAELAEHRRGNQEKAIRKDPVIGPWLEKLGRPERQTANKVIRAITSSDRLDDAKRRDLAKYMMVSFEQQAFRDLVAGMDENPEPDMLLEMFNAWNVIEAKEIHRIVEGRMDAIRRLEKLVNDDAREVPALHEFFAKWPWILDPTWTRWQDEVTYSNLLREYAPEKDLDERDRRIDFVAIGNGNTINVIELKRPGHVVKPKDLTQLADYVGFVRENLGTTSRSYHDVIGYLVAGRVGKDRFTRDLVREAKTARRYVVRYTELLSSAKNLHREFEDKLKAFEAGSGG